MKDFDTTTARELLEDAKAHMQEAIESLRRYVELTNDRTTEAYILDHLRIMTSQDHGFMSRDRNIDDAIASLDDYEFGEEEGDEDDGPDAPDYGAPGRPADDGEGFLRLVESSGGEPRLSGLYDSPSDDPRWGWREND